MNQIPKKTPKIILKEALYAKLSGTPQKELSSDIQIKHTFPELLFRYGMKNGFPPGMRREKDFKVLRQEMAAALRNRVNAYDICIAVANQAFEKGLPSVMFGTTYEAKQLKTLAKEVIVEVNRAKSLYFKPYCTNPPIVMADYITLHDTADLILKYFSKRYPTRIPCLRSARKIYWLKENSLYSNYLTSFKPDDVLISKQTEDKPYWEMASAK